MNYWTRATLREAWNKSRHPFDIKRCRWRNHIKARRISKIY